MTHAERIAAALAAIKERADVGKWHGDLATRRSIDDVPRLVAALEWLLADDPWGTPPSNDIIERVAVILEGQP